MGWQEERDARATWTAVLGSPLGWIGAAGDVGGLLRVRLPVAGGRKGMRSRLAREHPGAAPLEEGPLPPALAALAGFLSGRGRPPEPDLRGLPAFESAALRWISRIPAGRVGTYGAVASWMGRRGAARAVGGASARNPLPLIVPCHRVVGSGGRLTGFSTDGGLVLKRRLLEGEGVRFRGDRVEGACLLSGPPRRISDAP